jgi:hypothetical protein
MAPVAERMRDRKNPISARAALGLYSTLADQVGDEVKGMRIKDNFLLDAYDLASSWYQSFKEKVFVKVL